MDDTEESGTRSWGEFTIKHGIHHEEWVSQHFSWLTVGTSVELSVSFPRMVSMGWVESSHKLNKFKQLTEGLGQPRWGYFVMPRIGNIP